MITQQESAKGLTPGFDVDEKHFIATHVRKLLDQFTLDLLLCNMLANRPAKACNNKSKQVNSALS